MLIFHIAERSRWEAAKQAGAYAWSTLDKTLDDEGFLHASREDQWEAVRERYYADVRQPLVLLVIDTDKLTSPWREDPVGDDSYPHIYGPLNPAAVVEARPLTSTAEPTASFFRLFLSEAAYRMGWALLSMIAAVVVHAVVRSHSGDGQAFVAALATLFVGAVLATVLYRPIMRR